MVASPADAHASVSCLRDPLLLAFGEVHGLGPFLVGARAGHAHVGGTLHPVHLHGVSELSAAAVLPRRAALHAVLGIFQLQHEALADRRALLAALHLRGLSGQELLRILETSGIPMRRRVLERLRHLDAMPLAHDLFIGLHLGLRLIARCPLQDHVDRLGLRHGASCQAEVLCRGPKQTCLVDGARLFRHAQLDKHVPALAGQQVGNLDHHPRALSRDGEWSVHCLHGRLAIEDNLHVLRNDAREAAHRSREGGSDLAHILHEGEGCLSLLCKV
mmetsp:Transcript_136575/g.436304  ORF Transcript_136575/g.436304 Transcript_136575/m.436304 type:complete len:274 (-) Transcript_136575:950-1771(-)